MAPTAIDWAKLKVTDLRAELKQRGLSVAGRKYDLVHRLTAADEENSNEEATSGDAKVTTMNDKQNNKILERGLKETEEGLGKNEEAAESKPEEDSHATLNAPPDANTKEAEVVPEIPSPSKLATEASLLEPLPPPPSAVPMSEVVTDAQKRKRRSLTPPPSLHNEDAIRNKRQRVESETPLENQSRGKESTAATREATTDTIEPETASLPLENESASAMGAEPGGDMKLDKKEAADVAKSSITNNGNNGNVASSDVGMEDVDSRVIFIDTSMPPAIHPPTNALYICHLMRPLRPVMLEEYLAELATSPSSQTGGASSAHDSVLQLTYLDPIKTHAFAVFNSTTAAIRARAALHGQVWPKESNRRPLWVDFVPGESVTEWIDREEAIGGAGGSRSSAKKWEVVYSENDGHVVTTLLEIRVGVTPSAVPGRVLYIPSTGRQQLPSDSVTGTPAAIDSASVRELAPVSGSPLFDAPRGPNPNATVKQRDERLLRDRLYEGSQYGSRRPQKYGQDIEPRRDHARRKGQHDTPFLDDDIRTTHRAPPLDYRLVHPDLAQRRLDNIRMHRYSGREDADQSRGLSLSHSRSRS